jgi:hypothetical protein
MVGVCHWNGGGTESVEKEIRLDDLRYPFYWVSMTLQALTDSKSMMVKVDFRQAVVTAVPAAGLRVA